MRLPSCFVRSPPPPRSTLFPYTTLFRSREAIELGRQALTGETGRQRVAEAAHAAVTALLDRPIGRPADLLDRKSTRLNSSHVAISYAVFCLKKKKVVKSRGSFQQLVLYV